MTRRRAVGGVADLLASAVAMRGSGATTSGVPLMGAADFARVDRIIAGILVHAVVAARAPAA